MNECLPFISLVLYTFFFPPNPSNVKGEDGEDEDRLLVSMYIKFENLSMSDNCIQAYISLPSCNKKSP